MNTSEDRARIVDFLEFIGAQDDDQTIDQKAGWTRCAVGKACGLNLNLSDYDYSELATNVMEPLVETLEYLTPEFHEELNNAGNTGIFPTYAELKAYVNEAHELTPFTK